MKTQQVKNNKNKVNYAKLVLLSIVAILLFLLLISSVFGLMNKYLVMRKYIKSLKKEQVELQDKMLKISSMNEYVDTPEGQEQIFRDKFRVVKPGEKVIIIKNTEIQEGETVSKKSGINNIWISILKGLGLK